MNPQIERIADDVTRDGKSLGCAYCRSYADGQLTIHESNCGYIKRFYRSVDSPPDPPLVVSPAAFQRRISEAQALSDSARKWTRERFIFALGFTAGFTFALLLVVIWKALR